MRERGGVVGEADRQIVMKRKYEGCEMGTAIKAWVVTHSWDPTRGAIADCGGPSECYTQQLEEEAWEEWRPSAFDLVDSETRDTAAFI